MRKLGIDYGDSRIGFALSDPMGIIASPFEIYQRRNINLDIEYIKNIVKTKEVDKIVVGIAINMDGSHGNRVEKTKAFCELIKEALQIPIVYIDERWTTVQADRSLEEMNIRKDKRKDYLDKMAAQIILQSYLDNPFIK